MVGQIGIMYLICALALFFYVSRIPEVWFPGKLNDGILIDFINDDFIFLIHSSFRMG